MAAGWKRLLVAGVLVGCARPAPAKPDDAAYPKAYAGAPADPLASALDFVHRTVAAAREQKETIQLACLRAKDSKLEALRDERASLAPAEVDARATSLQSDAERCIRGN